MVIVFFLFGTLLGSYANALIFRFGNNKPILADRRSYCDHCGIVLGWFELLPVFSFLFQRGKCNNCRERIAIHNPLVELAMGVGFAYVGSKAGFWMMEIPSDHLIWLWSILALVAIFSFIFFFAIDLLYMVIPDQVSLPLIAAILIIQLALNIGQWKALAIAGILGASFFALQYVISKGRWIGGGDIRLGALLGVLLGWQSLIVALIVAYCLGMVVALILLTLTRATMKTAIPFGVFLMTGGFVSFFFSTPIIHWYTNDLPRVFASIFF